jgi:hypothetical protein
MFHIYYILEKKGSEKKMFHLYARVPGTGVYEYECSSSIPALLHEHGNKIGCGTCGDYKIHTDKTVNQDAVR